MNSRIAVTLGAMVMCGVLGASVANYDRTHNQVDPPISHSQSQSPTSESSTFTPPVAVYQPLTPTSEASQSQSSSQSQSQAGYWLRTDEGRLGVFLDGQEQPEMVFDVYVKYLPEADRIALEQGIYVDSYDELIKSIEDYVS